eukprot:evm.model.scf_612.8 EVM.evm.TU.scf_612.8   scf_612:65646-66672(+)
MQLARTVLTAFACLLCCCGARAQGQRAHTGTFSKNIHSLPKTILNHRLFSKLKGGIQSSAQRFLHARGQRTFDIPVEIDVVLVGFDGVGAYEYKVDPHKLEDLLASYYNTRRPHAKDLDEQLFV